MNKKILCVDDDANILAGFQRNLRKQFSVDTAVGGDEGLAAIKADGPYAVVVADMQMPGMNGLQFLANVEERAPDTVRIMLTGNADQKTAIDAVNEGHVFRFLTKPCTTESLAATLESSLVQYQVVTAERDVLERTLNGTIKALRDILSILDPAAFGFGQKICDAMRTYIRRENIVQSWDLELAAMLCQVGFVTIPAAVLVRFRSNLALRSEEKDMLARVPLTGSELLANIPRLEGVARIVLYQNKNFDGTGFPIDSVKGDQIPHGSRILRVLTDLFAIEARGHSLPKALAEMKTHGGLYDPAILESISFCFDGFGSTQSGSSRAGRDVALRDLQVGNLLLNEVQTLDGLKILSSGTLVTPVLWEKLKNFATVIGVREPLRIE